MNAYLVNINVEHKDTKQTTQWLVEALDETGAKLEALYKENHTYSKTQVYELCSKDKGLELREGNFHYKVVSVIELQKVKVLDAYEDATILVPKNISLIDTIDDIVPIDGSLSIQMVTFGWIVDGVHKEVKKVLGGKGKYSAIAYAVSEVCGELLEDDVQAMINDRKTVKPANSDDVYFIKDSTGMRSIGFSIGDDDTYLSRIPENKTDSENAVLAKWNLGV